ncbi:TonB-dependent receptor [Nibricoccus aquaticus]|uniref:TonB-dependent receptor n=1 Tax=Nibricoccus aquaticus TaxID=2576891 RepID=A0A290Q3Z4_9BACT|nr:TonB-dependent receptor [Nibricoccus aquaticus]ATC63224.1 TonB-dependent receptor [Nibricoccus aquaticus]
MHPTSLSRLAGRSSFAIACALAASTAAPAQTADTPTRVAHLAPRDVTALDKIVVSASRAPQALKNTPSSVTDYTPEYLGSAQVISLQDALNRTPGVSLVSLGGRGSQASVYIRGSEADHVLFFVDGVRMNSAQAHYSGFLGAADLGGLERLEILRGPQSTLYGSSAIGGVILLETAATGSGRSLAQTRAGSFDTFGASLATRGRSGPLGFSASLGYEETDNFRPDNGFKLLSYTARLEASPAASILLGATLRGQDGTYDEVGSTVFPGYGRADDRNHLVTTFAQWSPASDFASRVTVGWHQNEYDWTDKQYGPDSNFYSRNTRRILDWQNTWDATSWLRLVAGANLEKSTYSSSGQDLDDDLKSVYLSASAEPVKHLTIDAGLRTDDYDLTERADTWRTGVAYRIDKTGTKLRATYGTGFKAPTVVNRYGSEPWYGPNPAIGPEKSKGWDAGIDQEILGEKLTASLTYFRNDFRDLILSNFSMTTFKYVAQNVRRARSDGAELALTARPIEPLTLRAAYTYTNAFDTSATPKARLPRRPRHITDLDAQYQLTNAWLLGAGVHFEADRVLNVTTRLEDFTTTRIYTSYAINETVTVKFRIENALDEDYWEVAGYPSAPRAIYTSLDWKF